VEQFALKNFSPLNAGFTNEGPLRRSSGNTELFTANFLQDLERMVQALSTHATNPITRDSREEMPQLELTFEQCETEILSLRTGTELLNRSR
jgi:hypothetical protein